MAFEPPADALVHALKYGGWRGLAPVLGRRMAALDLPDPPPDARRAVVVPVPTTPARERARGYNQAALLARSFADRRGLPLVDALVRRDGGGTQVALHPDERRANVRDAFALAPGSAAALEGAAVLLVDDVLTTGATAGAAATTLERGGTSGVVIVAFARSIPDGFGERPEVG